MITGKTRLFGVIADPIHHVRAPQMLNPLFLDWGVDAVLVPFHVPPGRLADAVAGFKAFPNLGGFAVTIPHKESMHALCDDLDQTARRVGAVNCVRREPDGRLIGAMFDGSGFIAGMRAHGFEPRGQKTLLLGAGGAAAAIAFALADEGVARLVIANRTISKAQDMAARVAAAVPGVPVAAGPADPAGFDLIINATSVGLKAGDPPPLDPDRLDPASLVAEIIMDPEMTPLLAAAKARGCRIHFGRPMLAEQLKLIGSFMMGT